MNIDNESNIIGDNQSFLSENPNEISFGKWLAMHLRRFTCWNEINKTKPPKKKSNDIFDFIVYR